MGSLLSCLMLLFHFTLAYLLEKFSCFQIFMFSFQLVQQKITVIRTLRPYHITYFYIRVKIQERKELGATKFLCYMYVTIRNLVLSELLITSFLVHVVEIQRMVSMALRESGALNLLRLYSQQTKFAGIFLLCFLFVKYRSPFPQRADRKSRNVK